MTSFDGEPSRIRSHPERPGLVAVVTLITDKTPCLGVARQRRDVAVGDPTGFLIEDVDWIDRDGEPILLMATDVGLYQLPMRRRRPRGSSSTPGCRGWASTPWPCRRCPGEVSVAVRRAGEGRLPVERGGQFQTFRNIGLAGRTSGPRGQKDGPNRSSGPASPRPAATTRARHPVAGSSSAARTRSRSGAHRCRLAGRLLGDRLPGRDGPRGEHQSGVLWLDTGTPNALAVADGRQRPAAPRPASLPPVDTVAASPTACS
jgi:hypothetical protein